MVSVFWPIVVSSLLERRCPMCLVSDFNTPSFSDIQDIQDIQEAISHYSAVLIVPATQCSFYDVTAEAQRPDVSGKWI